MSYRGYSFSLVNNNNNNKYYYYYYLPITKYPTWNKNMNRTPTNNPTKALIPIAVHINVVGLKYM